MKVALFCLALVFAVHSCLAATGTVRYDSGTWTLVSGIDPLGVAFGEFVDEISKDGWGKLHIQTNPQYDDTLQMFAAGYLEGALTSDRIYEQYVNVYSSLWGNLSTPMPPALRNWLLTQNQWAHNEAHAKAPGDYYWGQVLNVLNQFDGLVKGYNDHAAKPLDVMAFIILNGVGDLIDLTAAFSSSRPQNPEDWDYSSLKNWIYNTHCSSLIKVTGDLSNLYAGHTAWYVYPAMLRIAKYYTFPLNNPRTASPVVTFSSYPGFLESLDDFYITSQQLIVIETSNSIFNTSLYKLVRENTQVLLSWQRTLVANRMSSSGEEWARFYSMHNSGTYNNQWIVVDLKRFKPYDTVGEGTLVILEQIPGYIEYGDQSKILEKGYWPSYNVPFYEKIFRVSGYAEMAKRQPIMLSYDTCCRANIFRRDQHKADTNQGFKNILRYNDYKNDPYSQGNPGYSISSRFDLEATDPQAFGGLDNKMTDYNMARNLIFEAVSGPTDVQQPSFSWNERGGIFNNQSHLGQPETFNFGYVVMRPKQFF